MSELELLLSAADALHQEAEAKFADGQARKARILAGDLSELEDEVDVFDEIAAELDAIADEARQAKAKLDAARVRIDSIAQAALDKYPLL